MATTPMLAMFRDQYQTATTYTTREEHMMMKAAAVVSDHHQAAATNRPKAKKLKKVPQRGMGVAQLERLRAKEKLNALQIPDPINSNYPLIRTGLPLPVHVPIQYGNNRSYYGVPLINDTVQVHRWPNGGYGRACGGSGPVSVGPNWLGGSSKELSSIPNINSGLCFKKKYPNYQESAMYNTKHPHFNRDHINGFGSTNAAHSLTNESRKGSSRTFLEYEFFPIEEKQSSVAAAGSEASFVNGNSAIATTGYRTYTPIDLSLKL